MGKQAGNLIRGLGDHGKPIFDLAGTIALVTQADGIPWGSRHGGVNSWYLVIPGRPRILLKGVPTTKCIEVRLREREAARLTLTSRVQIVRWAEAGYPC